MNMDARYCMNCGAELGPAEAWLCFYCEEYEREQKKREAELLKELSE